MRSMPRSAKKHKELRRKRPYGDLARMAKLKNVPLYNLRDLMKPKPQSPMVSLQSV